MKEVDELDLETIKNTNMSLIKIKRQMTNVIEYSRVCSAIVERIEKNIGSYRFMLEKDLAKDDHVLDSSYYYG
jgi:hypothetical protein